MASKGNLHSTQPSRLNRRSVASAYGSRRTKILRSEFATESRCMDAGESGLKKHVNFLIRNHQAALNNLNISPLETADEAAREKKPALKQSALAKAFKEVQILEI